MNNPDTICAIATAQGGAIGLIRVSGPDAIAFTDRIFTPVSSSVPLTQRKPYTLTFGHIKNAKGEIIDEVLISVFRTRIREKTPPKSPAMVRLISSSK